MTTLMVRESNELEQQYIERFGDLTTTEEILAFARDAVARAAQGLLDLAFSIRRMEEIGGDVDELRAMARGRLLAVLRRVAFGQIIPELAARYYLQPHLTLILGNLPIPDQVKAARGEGFEVAVRDSNGGWTKQKMAVEEIAEKGTSLIHQVFAGDRLRTFGEQRAYLSRKAVATNQPGRTKLGPFVVDRETGTWTFAGKRNTVGDAAQLKAVIRALEA